MAPSPGVSLRSGLVQFEMARCIRSANSNRPLVVVRSADTTRFESFDAAVPKSFFATGFECFCARSA